MTDPELFQTAWNLVALTWLRTWAVLFLTGILPAEFFKRRLRQSPSKRVFFWYRVAALSIAVQSVLALPLLADTYYLEKGDRSVLVANCANSAVAANSCVKEEKQTVLRFSGLVVN